MQFRRLIYTVIILALLPLATLPATARPTTALPLVAQNEAGLVSVVPGLQNGDPDTLPYCYRTVDQLYADLSAYVAAYPSLTDLSVYGQSWDKVTAGGDPGYDLMVLRLTNEAITGAKPRFFTDGGIHAREIAGPELVMAFIDRMLTQYNVDPDVTAVLDYTEIYVVVDSNPDGHHKVEGASSGWRKNTNSNLCSTGSYGIDLNRNQDFKWGCCGGSSSDPCDETYRGTGPASEPEIQSYETLVRSLLPDQRGPGDNDPAPITATGFLINYHSYGGDVLHPWGWTTNPAPNSSDLIAIAKKYASYNGYQVLSALYPVDGNTRDWAYGELGVPGYVVEVGTTFFESCTNLPNVINENTPALFAMVKLVDMPYLRVHGPHANAPLQVRVQGETATITATVTFVWSGNPNSQNVGGAELYIDTPPVRGGTPIVMSAVDGTFNSPTEVVRAQVDVSALPDIKHLVFVRGRGVNPYAGLPTWGPVTGGFLDLAPSTLTNFSYTPAFWFNYAP